MEHDFLDHLLVQQIILTINIRHNLIAIYGQQQQQHFKQMEVNVSQKLFCLFCTKLFFCILSFRICAQQFTIFFILLSRKKKIFISISIAETKLQQQFNEIQKKCLSAYTNFKQNIFCTLLMQTEFMQALSSFFFSYVFWTWCQWTLFHQHLKIQALFFKNKIFLNFGLKLSSNVQCSTNDIQYLRRHGYLTTIIYHSISYHFSNTMNYSHYKMNSKLFQSTINVYLYKIKNQSILCDRMSPSIYAYSAWKIIDDTAVKFSIYYNMGQIIIFVKNLFFHLLLFSFLSFLTLNLWWSWTATYMHTYWNAYKKIQ